VEPKPSIRILVADDHPVVRDGLVAILSTQPDFLVVGEAGTGAETVRSTLDLQPDVLLLDLEMPDLDGAQVLARLREEHVPMKTLVFTAYDTDERILTSIRLGAQGYLLKGAPREQVFQAIRVIAAGGSLLEPVVAMKLIQNASGKSRTGKPLAGVDALTSREIEVLRCLAEGKTNKEIGRELVITERTVKFHVSAILGKLEAGNRTEAVKKAVQMKLIEL
jgi:DNA-binding NarL/FixJ family response regulator